VVLDNAGDGFLQAYLLLGTDNQAYAIHMVTRYPTLPGMVTPWDGLRFGFIGECVGGLAQPVEFPSATAFELAQAAVRVPTVGVMEARWLAAGSLPYLEPLDPADADSELVRTRRTPSRRWNVALRP